MRLFIALRERKLKIHHYKYFITNILIGLLCFAASNIVSAQTDKMLVDLADEMYAFGDYEDALGLYLQAVKENPENVRGHYQAGECYLITTFGKSKAVNHFVRAHDLDPEFSNMILYKIAESYRFALKFDQAIEFFKKFKEEIAVNRRLFDGLDTNELLTRTDRKIYECENAKQYIKTPVTVTIENLGANINSEHTDYAPVLSADQNTLIFTSRRAGGVGILKDVDNKYFEDIWIAKKNGNNWSTPENLGEIINTGTHESNLGLSADGTRLYIYKTENLGDIFYSEMKSGKWTKPKSLGKPINTEYKEISAFETSDGKQLFISSDRPGGVGKADIYVCKKDSKGLWGEPKLLSESINTPNDEEGPFFDVNSNTLYFSSKGHQGMGGFDLYKSVFNPSTSEWSAPINLGYPINSTDDDLYFIMGSDGKTGYYSTFKQDSKGENDIYKIYPLDGSTTPTIEEEPEPIIEEEPEVVEIAKPIDTLVTQPKPSTPIFESISLQFEVIDYETQQPLKATIEIVDKETNEKIFVGDITGKHEHLFTKTDKASSIILVIESEGYLFQTFKIDIPQGADKQQTIKRTVGMRVPKEKVINILRNIYFDFDMFTLKKESYNELSKLLKLMNENPTMKVEVAGHTDFIGGEAYNNTLSLKRAQAVYNYLKENGIPTSRLNAKGYGEERPIASNDDEEEGRALNRRTEFIIISK